MNIDDELKKLTAATSRDALARTSEQDLDAETLELREGWRVLAKALEASSGPFDEASLIAKLQRDLASPTLIAETNRRGNGWMVLGMLGGVLAASLLVMVALGSGWFRHGQPVAKPGKTAIPQQREVVKAPSGFHEHEAGTPSWDDPLDSQISVAAAQMQTMQKPALPLDASISTLNYQLQQMAQDLDDGAL